MRRVAAALEARELSTRAAAAAIGVTQQTLEKHLQGEHVRSDSAAKYQDWLEGRSSRTNVFVLPAREAPPELEDEAWHAPLPDPPAKPHLVVDIFSGCGGLSLGFDLLGTDPYFRTILAVDNQPAPIAVLNRNAFNPPSGSAPVGRQMDLTEFLNEEEFLAFYLEHVALVDEDRSLSSRLHGLANRAFPRFREAVSQVDSAYLHDLNAARNASAWQAALNQLDKAALGQTSVIGFHEQLRLPRAGGRPASLPPVVWGDPQTSAAPCDLTPPSAFLVAAQQEWDGAVARLAERQNASGRGQLSTSARRTTSFVRLLDSPAMTPIRRAWCLWRARRLHVRATLFEDPIFAFELRSLYAETRPVSVLVGGPPCQGFSRIGRGKIRSLREARVHVHGDAEAGDARNLLFRQYVMVLEALRPAVFLFENVPHFQSTVKAEGVEFQATEVLAEAIANMSEGEVSYEVSSGVLDAWRHGVPQTRQRYFMCGVRSDGSPRAAAQAQAQARAVLELSRRPEVTLADALAGLPQPHFVGGASTGAARESTPVRVAPMRPGAFADWIRQPAPDGPPPEKVDGHVARAARADDSAFFALLGPGKRWMDYRADQSPTVEALRDVLETLANLPENLLDAVRGAAARQGRALPDAAELNELSRRVDGSLPLRLMLEQIGERIGAPHHLLAGAYLEKRDGHHGDWVARMEGSRPAKTMVSHMGKDTYGYVHPWEPRTISVREAARVQTFPDWFVFGGVALTDAFRMIGNAVPPLLSHEIARNVAMVLAACCREQPSHATARARPSRLP
jgi:site-specific DNA-cytosine methylase